MRSSSVLPQSAFAALLLSAFFVQGLFLIHATSPTTDEVAFHAVNGYVFLKTHDYRMSPANPPLIREWSALPWFFYKPALDLNNASWAEADSVPFSLKFFYKDNRAIADKLLYSARFMVLLLGVALGWVIYVWSRKLYGPTGGLLSLALYSFSPDFLGHSALANIDVGAAFFSVTAAYFLWKYLEEGASKDFWLLSLFMALTAAAKFSTLFMLPLFLIILLIKKGPKVFLKAIPAFAVCTFLVIWASFCFEFKPLLGGAVPRVGEKLGFIATGVGKVMPGASGVLESLQKIAQTLPIPAPTYLLGLAGIIRNHRQIGFPHYAFGEWTTQWHWWYYFFSFLVKMTIPFLCLLLLRTTFVKKTSSSSSNENWALLVPVLTMFVLICFDTFAMGVRYLFPVLPLLFVWVGGLTKLAQGSRLWKWTVSALLAAHVVAALSVFPNEMSFFNSSVGGSQGAYRYLRGSDLDWGQGLKELKSYLDKNNVKRIKLEYFGTADPAFYGIPLEPLTPEEKKAPGKDIYAISLFYLEHTDWAFKMKPSAIVGGSIAVYDLR